MWAGLYAEVGAVCVGGGGACCAGMWRRRRGRRRPRLGTGAGAAEGSVRGHVGPGGDGRGCAGGRGVMEGGCVAWGGRDGAGSAVCGL